LGEELPYHPKINELIFVLNLASDPVVILRACEISCFARRHTGNLPLPPST
jgi:hypothetical protein